MTERLTIDEAQALRTRALELLRYEPDTGRLFWTEKASRNRGREAGTLHRATGYWQVSVDYRIYKSHRLIWLMEYGEWPTQPIQHVDGDRGNNSLSNLRLMGQVNPRESVAMAALSAEDRLATYANSTNPQHVALLKRAQDEQEREYQLERSYLEHLGRDPDEAVMKPLSHFV